MVLTVQDVNVLQEYIAGVISCSDHHAGNVNEISLALAGAIVWKKDDQPIKVMAHGEESKNVLWAHIGGTRYAFAYKGTH